MSTLIGVIAGVLAVIVAIPGVLYARAAIVNQKKEIRWRVRDKSRLVSATPERLSIVLKVYLENPDLPEPVELILPTFVSVELRNSGRKAVTTPDFDAERPIEIDLGAPIVAIISRPKEIRIRENLPAGLVLIGPDLIRRGENVNLTCLVDGDPDVKIRHHFAEVVVREVAEDRKDRPLSSLWAASISALSALVAVGFTLFVASQNANNDKVVSNLAYSKVTVNVSIYSRGERYLQSPPVQLYQAGSTVPLSCASTGDSVPSLTRSEVSSAIWLRVVPDGSWIPAVYTDWTPQGGPLSTPECS